MIPSNAKVQAAHLQRPAYIYVRQSDPIQVRQHQESALRQYGLELRARTLGWLPEQIVTLDEDQGRSASNPTVTRTGFQQLLTEVALGRVGAVFNLEVSRLARQDSEWHRLVEVAALTAAILIDEQEIYDPRLPDDRLLLGLKGLLSSNEIRQMSLRLWQNKLHKAQRGALAIPLPIGLVFDPTQGVRLDPDEQVRAAVNLLFERFRLTGGIGGVVRYFQEQGLLFPKRQKGGWQGGPLLWGRLSCSRMRSVLAKALYDSSEYGTKLIESLIPGSGFTYPKSLWSVFDAIKAVCENDKDAIILDFPAG